jgi:hypothetical protein
MCVGGRRTARAGQRLKVGDLVGYGAGGKSAGGNRHGEVVRGRGDLGAASVFGVDPLIAGDLGDQVGDGDTLGVVA